MNIRILLSVSFLFCIASVLTAQDLDESLLKKAMHDELQRNYHQLKLANFDTPFFLSYTVGVKTKNEITAALGATTKNNLGSQRIEGSIGLLLGDYHRTSDVSYNNQEFPVDLPNGGDYNEIRRTFWLATDKAYKTALKTWASKKTYLKANPKTVAEESMDDFSKANLKSYSAPIPEFSWNQEKMKALIEELSKIFVQYPRLFNSSVSIDGQQMTIYKETSEGITIREPSNYVMISAQAYVMACDGVRLKDNWSELVLLPQDLPSLEDIKLKIKLFAENLLHLADLKPIDEFYSGPVLFEKAASKELFISNFLKPGLITGWRKPEGKKSIFTLDGRIGRKVIDSRLSIKNYSSLSTYNNVPLLGSYLVDAEGVEIEKENVLVEAGIIKKQLNGRIPCPNSPVSTGSSRFALMANPVQYVTAPGTVHFSVKNGQKPDKMKKELIKAACEEGLDYAYIVRNMKGQASLIYRVDVKTGEETQVRAGEFAGLNLAKLKRLRGISSKEEVSNYYFNNKVLSSIIYPSSVLIDDVEMNVPQLRIETPDALTFPLLR